MITALYLWKVSWGSTPRAVSHMATDQLRLRLNKDVSFFKLLGTGKGESFTPSDADLTRWGLLVTLDESALENFDNSAMINNWRKFSRSEYRIVLQPLSAHGKWSGKQPFSPIPIEGWDGSVAAITRARIKSGKNLLFHKSVPPVVADLHTSSGLEYAIGIGEAPIGLQGTFSLWKNNASLREFAYKGHAHTQAILATEREKWYSEELFARFAVIEQRGEINGQPAQN